MTAHTCNPSAWEAEAEESQLNASLSCIARPHLNKQIEIIIIIFP
jgi:hypothetical protein